MTGMTGLKMSDTPAAHRMVHAAGVNETDLMACLALLLAAWKRVVAVVLAFAFAGLSGAYVLPQKWTSEAVITPATSVQWQALRQTLTDYQALDAGVNITPEAVFTLFIEKFQSQSVLEDFITTSPLMAARQGDDPQQLRRAVDALAQQMTATDNGAVKNAQRLPFTAWTLRFTAPAAADAQQMLAGYIATVSGLVEQETLENIRGQIALKIRLETLQVARERMRLSIARETRMQRLAYSLEIAKAAGLRVPAFGSAHQGVSDDPDFPVALGADGIAKKLEIIRGLDDASALDAGFRSREYRLKQLQALPVPALPPPVYHVQRTPSLPVYQDGPGKALRVLLASLLGGFIACGSVIFSAAWGRERAGQ